MLGNLFFFFFFLGPHLAYGTSQARSQIGVTAASLHHSHSPAGSKPCLQPTPQLTPTPDPLIEARDWTCILMDMTQICFPLCHNGNAIIFFKYIFLTFWFFWSIFYFILLFTYLYFLSVAHGSSQTRGRFRATAASLHHSHSNARSKPHLQPTPWILAPEQGQGLNPASSWTLCQVLNPLIHNRNS